MKKTLLLTLILTIIIILPSIEAKNSAAQMTGHAGFKLTSVKVGGPKGWQQTKGKIAPEHTRAGPTPMTTTIAISPKTLALLAQEGYIISGDNIVYAGKTAGKNITLPKKEQQTQVYPVMRRMLAAKGFIVQNGKMEKKK